MVKFSTYVAASVVGVLGMVCHAVRTRQQFYLVMYYLSHSRISLALLVNMGLLIMCWLWQFVIMVFLGPLRETEVERLSEHFWREVMEILFAMTVFRDELHLGFLFWISVLLFVKTYHWLVQKRVEYIETTPSMERLLHVRLCTFMALLLTLDCLFFHRSFSHLLKTRQPSVSLFFAFEYAILTTTAITTCIKYALHVRDMFCEGRLTGKDVYVFYVEFVQDLLHLSLYLLFFLVVFIHYGLPLHLVRELYETFQNFKTRITDFIRYRRLTSNMNERFEEPTPEEISRDPTCIICREEMMGAKKLPCGHLFHTHCLRSWLERQHTCPTCRAPLLGSEDDQEQYDHEDEDIALDVPQYHEENFMGHENANFFEIDVTTNSSSEDNGQETTQTQASTNISNTPNGQNNAYLAFTDGRTTWYPVFVPLLFPYLRGGQAHLRPGHGSPNFESKAGQNSPGVLKDSCAYNTSSHQCSYMPRILRIPQNINRHQWDVALADTFESRSPYGRTPSACTHDSESEGVPPSARGSETLDQIITWNPGALSISRYDEQSAYLDRVIKVLKGQLQSALELQEKLNILQAKEHLQEFSSPREVVRDSDSENRERYVAQEVDLPTIYFNSDIDNMRRMGIEHIKDHCGHCPQTPSSSHVSKFDRSPKET